MINAQDWLTQTYPQLSQRNNLKVLEIPEAVTGWLDLKDFAKLESLKINSSAITGLNVKQCPKLGFLYIKPGNPLTTLDLTNCPLLFYYNFQQTTLQPFTFVEQWKQEIEQLKAKISELESQPTASLSDPSETLVNKLVRKRQELTRLQTSGRSSTANLRKEITLLEKLNTLEQQISQQQTRETNYLRQIQAKQAEIDRLTGLTNTDLTNTLNNLTNELQAERTAKNQLTQQNQAKEQELQQANTQNTQLEQSNTQKQSQIQQLTEQLSSLRSEKQQLEQRMVSERQNALALWASEKSNLKSQISTLTSEKNTSRQAADYLRTTLSTTESNKSELERQLAEEQASKQQMDEDHQAILTGLQGQLTNKQEAYILIQQRNSDLTSKLSTAGQENQQLTEWIERLEAASGQGNAFEGLQGELNAAQARITELEEQLSAKLPKNNYYWVYGLAILAILYLIFKK